ncbi:MAG: MFS transporter [Rhodospirillaceae bacterium]|nr:MFS transporter [Rhodospirillaceae bacterium]
MNDNRRGPPPAGPSSGDDVAARAAALSMLDGVFARAVSTDDQFDAATDKLDVRDRAFVRLLVATTLRRLGQIDLVLGNFVERRPPDRVINVLRLGAAQLLFLATPAHAAVATSVALVKQGHERHAGLVNAVLRRVSEKGAAMIATQDQASLNTPMWLWKIWNAAYGEPAARATAEAHLTEPLLDLTVKDPATREAWAQRLEARLLPTGSLRRTSGGRIQDLEGFAEGAWWVQDAAAALPAKILLHALGDTAGKTVIDLCAAPGGKTAQLAAAGCAVTAVDTSNERLLLLRDNMKRLHLSSDVISADAVTWRPRAQADAVLLDAPCSATGTIRRHPDLPYLKRAEDMTSFAPLQRKLLTAALDMVKPGGWVFYSVCSLQPEERRVVVEAVLADHPAMARVQIPKEALGGESQFIDAKGDLRTLPSQWPEHAGLDGFYGALLFKNQ